MGSSIFTKIIKGEIPAFKIAEDDRFFAFLDISPSTPGHTLVVPKIETDQLFDLQDEYLQHYLVFCKPIAHAIRQAFGFKRVNIITIGFEVPHAHIHLVGMNEIGDADILSHRTRPSQEDLAAAQAEILRFL